MHLPRDTSRESTRTALQLQLRADARALWVLDYSESILVLWVNYRYEVR